MENIIDNLQNNIMKEQEKLQPVKYDMSIKELNENIKEYEATINEEKDNLKMLEDSKTEKINKLNVLLKKLLVRSMRIYKTSP